MRGGEPFTVNTLIEFKMGSNLVSMRLKTCSLKLNITYIPIISVFYYNSSLKTNALNYTLSRR